MLAQTSVPHPKIRTSYYFIKLFVNLHLGYGDIIYEKVYNSSFQQKIESVQYNVCLAITGAIRGTSKEKFYNKLGIKFLQPGRWVRKLCYFYKFYKNVSPRYLFLLHHNKC